MSNAKWEDISQIVSPLGLGIKRAKALIRFSQEYISLTEQSDAFNLKKDEVMVSTSSIVCNQCFMNIQLNYFSLLYQFRVSITLANTAGQESLR